MQRGANYGHWWYWDDWGLGWRSPAEHGSAAATGLDMVVFGVAAIGVIKCYHDVYRCGNRLPCVWTATPRPFEGPEPLGRLLSPSASLLELLRSPSESESLFVAAGLLESGFGSA